MPRSSAEPDVEEKLAKGLGLGSLVLQRHDDAAVGFADVDAMESENIGVRDRAPAAAGKYRVAIASTARQFRRCTRCRSCRGNVLSHEAVDLTSPLECQRQYGYRLKPYVRATPVDGWMKEASVSRLLLLISVLVSGGCKTTLPKEEPETVVVPASSLAPAPARTEVQVASGGEVDTQSGIPMEPLQPVRGGACVLPPYLGPNPCKMALMGESPVAQACSAGGKRGAIELMQTYVRRANSDGFKFDCVDCHADEDDDYTELKPQADVEFRKLLFLARPE